MLKLVRNLFGDYRILKIPGFENEASFDNIVSLLELQVTK
jgi:hypothetical protein